MENKLRSLLKKMEELSSIEKCSDDSFVSLDESMAKILRATNGSKNTVCNTMCPPNPNCVPNNDCTPNYIC